MKSRKHLLHGSLWIGVYIFIIVAPLLVLLVGQPPPGAGFLAGGLRRPRVYRSFDDGPSIFPDWSF
jgi:hypothetical protein